MTIQTDRRVPGMLGPRIDRLHGNILLHGVTVVMRNAVPASPILLELRIVAAAEPKGKTTEDNDRNLT
jgi:hypothetical protein